MENNLVNKGSNPKQRYQQGNFDFTCAFISLLLLYFPVSIEIRGGNSSFYNITLKQFKKLKKTFFFIGMGIFSSLSGCSPNSGLYLTHDVSTQNDTEMLVTCIDMQTNKKTICCSNEPKWSNHLEKNKEYKIIVEADSCVTKSYTIDTHKMDTAMFYLVEVIMLPEVTIYPDTIVCGEINSDGVFHFDSEKTRLSTK